MKFTRLWQGWSPYNYCLNNPLGLVDPNGQESALPIDPIILSVTAEVGTGVIIGEMIYHAIKYSTDITYMESTNSSISLLRAGNRKGKVLRVKK
jgi:hypothetical protein